MKMKHWAYIGMALIEVNASLLGGARAAELTQGPAAFRQPALDFLRFRLHTFIKKPPKNVVAPVTVRLYAGQKVRILGFRGAPGFLVSGHTLEGPIIVSLQDAKLRVYRAGHFEFALGELTVDALEDQTFEVRTRQGSRRWTRGEIKLRVVKGDIQVVNRLDLEDYSSGILEGELGTLKLSPQVLKAQIIVARTYTLAMRGNNHHGEGYEFCDLPHCQVFGNIPHESNPALDVALAQVRGQYLSYKGRPIAAFYHHDCGGMTSNVQDVWPTAAQPYLVAVDEGPHSYCRFSPKSKWRFIENRKSLAACFRKAKWISPQEALDTIRVVKTDASGRAELVMLQGNRTLVIPVSKFRNVINQYYGKEVLRSALFTVARSGDRFVFNGRGWGHGVGFCQEGAKVMARHGKTYQEILAHYFPHTTLSQLP